MAGLAPGGDTSPSRSRWTWIRSSWFSTLFLTDMWERFSFFGMMAILYLYATAPETAGGLAFDGARGAALVGLYMSLVFLCSVPGGWLGDRVLGAQRATLYGGVVITLGHCCMAIPGTTGFAGGIALIAIGTGLLKPNLGVLLGGSYAQNATAEREAGFSIFYMSIQGPALVAPLVIGFIGEQIAWHLGFGVAAVGMALGVLRYRLGMRHLGKVGREPSSPAGRALLRSVALRFVIGISLVGALLLTDVLLGTFTIYHLLGATAVVTVLTAIWSFRRISRHPDVTQPDRARISAYIWIFLISVVMWAALSQSRSVLSGFAADGTDRDVGSFVVPASWFQSLHPLFILLSAPLFAWLWLRLGRRADLRVKLSVALALAGASFVVVALAITSSGGAPAAPAWIVTVFLIQACAELAFGPVSMGLTIETAPRGFASQMMGLWWLAAAVGSGMGGQLAALFLDIRDAASFVGFGLVPLLAAVAFLMMGRPVARTLSASSSTAQPADGPARRR